jgi:uncharacterized protein YqjF (DUF2071 family)
MAMQWHELAFLHWPVPAAQLRPLIPAGLELQTFDGAAWLGVVPFTMKGTRPRFLPPLPWFSDFPELNVRTYVTAENKPGVWFFSLDAANPLAVRGARLTFHLPYYDADMAVRREGDTVDYRSARASHRAGRRPANGSGRADDAVFVGRYGPTGPVYNPVPGSLDHWLTERYCLYSADKSNRIWRAHIHHGPWPLQPATADIDRNTMSRPLGIELPDVPPLVHFAQRQDVVAWLIHRVRA